MRRGGCFLLCALLLAVSPVGVLAGKAQVAAETKMYTFPVDAIPSELLQTAMRVNDQDVVIRMTFAGDCTLGGTEATSGWEKSFMNLVGERGFRYPFEKLQPLFAGDDITVVNLEGVLSDGEVEKQEGKTFNFIGSTQYARILTEGSVECVNLANNHVLDYGQQGYEDTVNALNTEGIAHFGENSVTVLEKDGIRIGFTGNLFTLADGRKERLDQQIKVLESVGCRWIAHTMHAGTEYADAPSGKQRSIAEYAVKKGAGLVVGHHPHVVQGIEMLQQVPVVYSLGNCSFGGNLRPRDYAACVLRAELRFVGGERESLSLSLHPIRMSGERRYNDYRPVLLKGAEAQRVIDRMQESSTVELAPFASEVGTVLPKIDYQATPPKISLMEFLRKSRDE